MKALVKNHVRAFLFVAFACFAAKAWGQPSAAFSATSTAGCSPLVVYFADSSSGKPTKWKWDLGNGAVSYLRNPSATYFNPGTYTIKLVVSSANGSDSVVKKEHITVYAMPVPAFDFTKSARCFPLPVQFKDSSTAGSGTIATWQWDFGDGTISFEQNPVHRYTSVGNFNVTLRITNSFGCTKTITKTGAVRIDDGITPAFTNTNSGICPAPAVVQFTNKTTGPGPLTFQWFFGDGNKSTASSPSNAFTSNGTYTVTLIASSPLGCVDTIKKNIVINTGAAKADFSIPSGACTGEKVTFINRTSPEPVSVHWDFGDGSTSVQTKPTKTYTTEGNYTVSLVSNFGTCSDTVKKSISIATKPVANFQAVKQAACRLPVAVQFKSLASGNDYQYQWNFGDSTIGDGAEPLHEYEKEGSYTVRLIVTTAGGCSDTIIKKAFVSVQKPALQLAGLPRYGCVPKSVTPSATYLTGQTIESYLWNFGDGTTSTEASPTYTYTKQGNYTVTLIVTTTEGCTDTVKAVNAVRLGVKPNAAFVNTPQITCPFEKVFYTDKSTGGADQWFWDFGDGGTSKQQSPFHQYSDTGWQKVTLVIYNNTCPDTVVVQNAVYINPPVSIFSANNDCNDKYTKQFTDRSMGPKTWFWEFGDGETSTEQHPVHTYLRPGRYNVKLTVTSDNCTHFSIRSVAVIDEKADFKVADSVICRNSTAVFNIDSINSANIQSWLWDYGNGITSNNKAHNKYSYTKAGTYNVSLTITDILGCISTKSLPVKVYGPTASFEPSVTSACLPGNLITLSDASTSDGEHPIRNWRWDYGDKMSDSVTSAPFQHRYADTGSFVVKLWIMDEKGCSDSVIAATPLVITQPKASFKVSDSVMCTGKSIQFTNTSHGVKPVHEWWFGDGKQSSIINPSHAYGATGIYSTKLVVTDAYGCKDSVINNNDITISYPKAAFALSDTFSSCPPLLVHFTSHSTNFKNLTWDFGDNNFSKLDTPSHFYATPGVFYATLVATGPGGCTDTARQKIEVKGPTGTFSYDPLSGCKPLTVHFKATTKNQVSFIWDFSDGSTVVSTRDSISHTYTTAGDFVPKIILTDAGGCIVPILGKDTIRVKDVSTDVVLDTSTLCDDGTVQFTNHTVSNDFISGYQWNFGDGNSSNLPNPSHHYKTPGSYTVQLEVTTLNGCSDKKQLTDTVKVYQSPVVQIKGDSAACLTSTFQYNGTVVRGNAEMLKWHWDMGNGQTASVQQPTAQTYLAAGDYFITAVATDNYGCYDTAFHRATVHAMPTTNAGMDQWICRGSFSQLKPTGADTYRWNSSPSLSCIGCEAPLAAPTETTQYIVTGLTTFGCSTADTIVVGVHQQFTLKVGMGDTVCAGKAIVLSATGAEQYSWLPSASVKDPSVGTTTATPAVSTLFSVIARDNAGCFTDSGSVYIKVWPIPTIQTETVKTLSVGKSMTLKPAYSSDVSSYQWSNAQSLSCATCPAPVAHPKSETKNTIEVKNDGGCQAKEAITINVICNDGNLFIPNTFSPNADGQNDRFYPRGTGINSIKSLKVFNRWGEMVFSRDDFNANDAAAGWDGIYKGLALSPDVYVYTCEVICMNNEVLLYRGDVTLLR